MRVYLSLIVCCFVVGNRFMNALEFYVNPGVFKYDNSLSSGGPGGVCPGRTK